MDRRRVLESAGSVPVASATRSADGKPTLRSELNGAPAPDGRKTSVWLSVVVQSPGTEGTTVGSAVPRTRETGSEKVSLIGERGSARPFGPVDTSTTGRSALGNQVTRTGTPSLSHCRAADLTTSEPVGVLVGSVTLRPDTAAPATETRSTGRSNRTSACAPRAARTHRFATLATGVCTVNVSRRSPPSAQLSHPGRRTTTEIEILSPDATRTRGVNRACDTTSGIARPSAPRARTLTSEPANGSSSTRPSADPSPVSRASESAQTTRAAAPTRRQTPSRTRSARGNLLRGGLLVLTPDDDSVTGTVKE